MKLNVYLCASIIFLSINTSAFSVELSKILENSLFDNTYVVAVVSDDPLIIDKDIYLNDKNLNIIANYISIPNDVSIYSFSSENISQPPILPSTPPKAGNGRPGPKGGHNAHGQNGRVGTQGRTGKRGLSAGKVKIVSINKPTSKGKLKINLFGQNGGKAQNGGEGGNGGKGGNAHNGSSKGLKCRREPGDGGNGGHGGTGGSGGLGGNGGDGGDITFSSNLLNFLINENIKGGKPGAGGLLGRGGLRAGGGTKGSRSGFCGRRSRHGSAGQNGSNGINGRVGQPGRPGSFLLR